MICQLERLRLCLPSRVRLLLNGLPKSLDETYERILNGIPEENRNHAQRLLQCLTVAMRPLRVDELAEILAFEFDAIEGELPTFNADWRSKDQEQEVLSACSSLITIVDAYNGRVVQFSHFSVKEYLTSDRLASSSEDISSYHIFSDAAHKTLAQASLGVLLRLDDHVDIESARRIPLANYAGEYWGFHVVVGNVSPHVMGTMKTLFDPEKPHFAAWVRIHDIDHNRYRNTATPLYYSALCGLYDLIEHLVKKHSQHVNAIGGEDDFPLVAALHGGHIRVAELLLQHGADVRAQGTEGRTPLHTVIGWSHSWEVGAVVGAAQFLFTHGADINARENDLSTPLHLAAADANFEVAKMLLERKVDVNSRNVGGETPLHLVGKGRFRWSKGNSFNLVQLLLEYGANVNSRDMTDETALHNASLIRSPEVARVLLHHGAYINAENSQGQTPFYQVFKWDYYKEDLVDVAQLLVEHGADVNTRDKHHETPLHLASYKLDLESVRVLLNHGANVNAKNFRCQTPLHQALNLQHYSRDCFGVAQLLVEHGADVNSLDKRHETPLHLASHKLDFESVRVVLDHGANVNAKNIQGQTPLHQALHSQQIYALYSSKDCSGVARLLVERGADVNSLGEGYETPLHLASFYQIGRAHV